MRGVDGGRGDTLPGDRWTAWEAIERASSRKEGELLVAGWAAEEAGEWALSRGEGVLRCGCSTDGEADGQGRRMRVVARFTSCLAESGAVQQLVCGKDKCACAE